MSKVKIDKEERRGEGRKICSRGEGRKNFYVARGEFVDSTPTQRFAYLTASETQSYMRYTSQTQTNAGQGG
jgi:hypothetical protein